MTLGSIDDKTRYGVNDSAHVSGGVQLVFGAAGRRWSSGDERVNREIGDRCGRRNGGIGGRSASPTTWRAGDTVGKGQRARWFVGAIGRYAAVRQSYADLRRLVPRGDRFARVAVYQRWQPERSAAYQVVR